MQKTINKGIVYCLLLSLCSCVTSLKDQESTQIINDSIGGNDHTLFLQMDKMELDEDDLRAYEAMALEKTMVFYELTKLLRSEKQNAEVKHVARHELMRLFVPGGVVIVDSDTLAISSYLELVEGKKLKVEKPSKLHFIQGFYFYNGKYEGSIAEKEKPLARYQLIRQDKAFGGHSKSTWEVLLVEIVL